MKKIAFLLSFFFLLCLSSFVRAGGTSCVITKVASCGGFLEGITVSLSGDIWLLDVVGDRILSIEDGQCKEHGKTGGGPNGAKFLANGNLVITDHQGLLEFNTKTSKLSVLVDQYDGEALYGLNDLAIDSNEGIYFTQSGRSSIQQADGRVFYLPPNSHLPQLLATEIAFPNGIAISPDERTIAVAEFAAKRILSLPSATVQGGLQLAYVFAHTSGGVGPDGIFIDENNWLYAANLGAKEILVYSEAAKLEGALSLPADAGNLVTNMVISKGKLYMTEAQKGEVWSTDYPLTGCLE